MTWDKSKDQRNSLWVVFWSLSACCPCAKPHPGGMSSRSKQQVPLLPAFSSQNNLLFSHPDVSTQIGFCSVLWNTFFFLVPHLHAPLKKKPKYSMVKWPSDPIPHPEGEHTQERWLACQRGCTALAILWGCSSPVWFSVHDRAVKPEQCPSLSVHWGCAVAQIKLWFLWEGAWKWEEQLSTSSQKRLFFSKGQMVWMHSWLGSIYLTGYLFTWQQTPTSDF